MSTVRTLAKNTSALFVAEAASRAASIFYFAVLARYILADGLGKLSTAQALVYTLIALVGFGFDQLTVRNVAARKDEATAYISNVGLLRLVFSLIFLLLLRLTVGILNYSAELALIVELYAINAILTTFTGVGLAIFQAFERMEFVFYARVLRDGVNVGLSLLAIHFRYGLAVIVGMSVVSSLIQLLVVLTLLRRQALVGDFEFDVSVCRRLFIGAVPFAVVAAYPLARTQLNTLILSVASSVESVGWFAGSLNIVNMTLMIPAIVMEAMLPVLSRFSSSSVASLRIAYQKSFRYLFILGMGVSVGMYLTSKEIVALVLGPGFEMAVPALRLLAWLPLVAFVGYCNGNLLLAMRREKLFMVSEGVFALAYGLLGWILVPRFGYLGGCVAIVAPTAIGFCFYSVLCHRLLVLQLPWKTAVEAPMAAAIMGVCVRYAMLAGANLLVVVLIVGPLCYGVSLALLGEIHGEDIMLLRNEFGIGQRNRRSRRVI